MTDANYYPGQWFDDMGGATLATDPNSTLGFELASTPGISRDELNGMVSSIMQAGYNPYD